MANAATVCASIAAFLFATSSSAQTPMRKVGRNDAWNAGASHGPSVTVARAASVAAGDLSSVATGLTLPPRLTVMAGPRIGSLGGGLDLTVTALVDMPLRAVGSSRSATAEAIAGAAKSDLARAQIDAGFEAAVAWSRGVEAKEVLATRERGERDLEAILAIASKRFKAGTGLPSDVALARGDLGAAGAATLDAEGNLVDALSDLRFAMGVSPDEALDPTGDLCTTNDQVVDEKATIADAEANAPLIATAKARSLVAAADVKLIHATSGPLIGFGAQYTRDALGEQIWSGIVTVPLPFVDPARFDSTRAHVAESEAAAEVERVRMLVRKAVRLALHDRVHTREVRAKLLRDALEPLREAVRLAHLQFEAGTQDLTSVLLTRQRLFTVEEQIVRACGAVHRADLALARLLGKAPS
jgi:cobalt-zinc-cadmium efflux system outer membrane protein